MNSSLTFSIIKETGNSQVVLSGEPTILPGTESQYWRGDKTFHDLTKSSVGLGNVDNTSDLNKPVSTAVLSSLELKANLANPTFTGTVSGSFSGPLNGNASTSTTSNNLQLTTNNLNSNQYITFSQNLTGANALYTDPSATTPLSYNPSSGTLNVSKIVGNQTTNSFSIGFQAGQNNQGNNAIAIGYQAGQNSQGNNTIAIGYQAGIYTQPTNSIILNASNSAITPIPTQSSLYINPIRNDTGPNSSLYYNTTTKEVVYGNPPSYASSSYVFIDMIRTPENSTDGDYYNGGFTETTLLALPKGTYTTMNSLDRVRTVVGTSDFVVDPNLLKVTYIGTQIKNCRIEYTVSHDTGNASAVSGFYGRQMI